MAALTTIIAGAALAVSAGSAVTSYKQGKKAASANKQAFEYQKKQNDLSAMRQKRDAIRAARIANAQVANTGASQNVSGSSGVMGGQGSIRSQLGDTLSFLDQWNFYSDQAATSIGKAQTYTQRAQTAGDISRLSAGLFNNSDLVANKVQSIFGK